jgi:(p)ppGpp synthase/HD superfamily hydrolase
MDDIVLDAMNFAYLSHKNHFRKINKAPYFVHLMDVVSILLKNGASEELVAAGYLHDVVEDNYTTNITEKDVRIKFGDYITDLVMAVTEKDNTLSWEERKRIAISHLAFASKDILMLKCADKLANLRDMLSDYLMCGLDCWKFYNGDIKRQLFNFESVLFHLKPISDLSMYVEYEERIDQLRLIVSDCGDDEIIIKPIKVKLKSV